MTDQDIENGIPAKGIGPTSTRVTLDSINAAIRDEYYYQPLGTVLTICTLTMENDFIVIGESTCVSPENFDAELGKKIARQNAVDKLWPLMGFHLAYCKGE